MASKEILFLGNGPLAEAALQVLARELTVVFRAQTKDDLAEICAWKRRRPELPAILASYGVLLPDDVLALFEPTGILNIHPSLLPRYRGPAPIEGALLAGDRTLGVSVMKITAAMDAGPIYYQTEVEFAADVPKREIYARLATVGAKWLVANLANLPEPCPQDEAAATYTQLLKKSDGILRPDRKTAPELAREVRAYAGFPKSKYQFGAEFGEVTCTILRAHAGAPQAGELAIPCAGDTYLIVDELQPESRKAMSPTAFINGYRKA